MIFVPQLAAPTCRATDGRQLRLTTRVKQGDLYFQVNFYVLVHQQLPWTLSQECCITFYNRTIRAVTFADELVFLAESLVGKPLFKRPDTAWEYCRRCERHSSINNLNTAAHLWKPETPGVCISSSRSGEKPVGELTAAGRMVRIATRYQLSLFNDTLAVKPTMPTLA